jgi:hypothetical protein
VLHLAVVFLVHPGHDLQHGGLAGAVEAEQADLGAGEEGQRDVLDDLAFGGNDLADTQHRHDVLGHGDSVRVLRWFEVVIAEGDDVQAEMASRASCCSSHSASNCSSSLMICACSNRACLSLSLLASA